MPEPTWFVPPEGESTALIETSSHRLDTIAGAISHQYEFSCRGDRVPLTLIASEADTPGATLLVQPAPLVDPTPGDPSGLSGLRGLRSWLGGGVAVASIELPLFGTRASAKLSEKLTTGIAASARGEEIPTTTTLLWTEFVRQSVMELRRSIDVLRQISDSSSDRVAVAGMGVGASVGAILCGVDERPLGAVLAGTGGGFGPEEIDPASYIDRVAPRPLLLIDRQDADPTPGAPTMPPERAETLRAAAGSQVKVESQTGETDLLGPAWKFLAPLLLN